LRVRGGAARRRGSRRSEGWPGGEPEGLVAGDGFRAAGADRRRLSGEGDGVWWLGHYEQWLEEGSIRQRISAHRGRRPGWLYCERRTTAECRGDRWKTEARWGMELLPSTRAGERKVPCTVMRSPSSRGGGRGLAAQVGARLLPVAAASAPGVRSGGVRWRVATVDTGRGRSVLRLRNLARRRWAW
jgi:hypothetical protein